MIITGPAVSNVHIRAKKSKKQSNTHKSTVSSKLSERAGITTSDQDGGTSVELWEKED